MSALLDARTVRAQAVSGVVDLFKGVSILTGGVRWDKPWKYRPWAGWVWTQDEAVRVTKSGLLDCRLDLAIVASFQYTRDAHTDRNDFELVADYLWGLMQLALCSTGGRVAEAWHFHRKWSPEVCVTFKELPPTLVVGEAPLGAVVSLWELEYDCNWRDPFTRKATR